jgi:hypothetical protein
MNRLYFNGAAKSIYIMRKASNGHKGAVLFITNLITENLTLILIHLYLITAPLPRIFSFESLTYRSIAVSFRMLVIMLQSPYNI